MATALSQLCFTRAGLSQHCGLSVFLLNAYARIQVYCDSAERLLPSTLPPHGAAPWCPPPTRGTQQLGALVEAKQTDPSLGIRTSAFVLDLWPRTLATSVCCLQISLRNSIQ